jgi:hypothetical protein
LESYGTGDGDSSSAIHSPISTLGFTEGVSDGGSGGGGGDGGRGDVSGGGDVMVRDGGGGGCVGRCTSRRARK